MARMPFAPRRGGGLHNTFTASVGVTPARAVAKDPKPTLQDTGQDDERQQQGDNQSDASPKQPT